MTIIGFNFTKIEAEKFEIAKGKINISNNVSVADISEHPLPLGKQSQSTIKFNFEFVSNYDPKIGSILLKGEVLYLDEAKKNKEIVDLWKKEKKTKPDLMTEILNTVLARCNIQALILSQDVNLPPPIPMPKVKVDEKK